MNLKLTLAVTAAIVPFAVQATVVVDALTGHEGFGSLILATNASAGQAFKTPDATNVVLKSFELRLRKDSPGAFNYAFKIHEWTGIPTRTIVGPELFSATGFVLPSDPGSWKNVAFTTNLTLDPAKRYLAFVTNVGEPASVGSAFIAVRPDNLAEGDALLNGHWNTIPAYGSNIWSDIATNDTAFRATFEPVPEPATLALLSAAALAAARRRKKA